MAAKRKKPARRRTPARRRNPAHKPPARRRKRNPKAGLTNADIRDLGSAAVGGVGAGLLTSYLDSNKPQALAQVPTEIVAAGLGVAIAAFGKTPILKNLSAGMISFAAGNWAAGMANKKSVSNVPGLMPSNVGALHMNPAHYHSNPGHTINVAGLTFAVEE